MSEKTPLNPPDAGGGTETNEQIERYGIKIEIPEPFLQKHLEEYQTEMLELSKGDIANAVYKGALVKAGIRCGWVSGMAEHEVPEKQAYVIEWASAELHYQVMEARNARPE